MSVCYNRGPDCEGELTIVADRMGASYGGCTVWSCRKHAAAYTGTPGVTTDFTPERRPYRPQRT